MKKFTGVLCALLLGLLTVGVAGATTYSYTGTLPATIPDGGSYLYADIEVGDPGIVADINVFVDVTHTDISDLDIYLAYQEPGSSAWKYYVQLFNQYGVPGDNLYAVTFDDEAAISIEFTVPRYGPGSFKPGSTFDEYGDSNLLSTFDGESIAGTWSLAIWDNYSPDVGTLNAFSIIINEENHVPIPGAIWLLGSGIIGLVGFGRKLRS
ncbi:hypothetical protein KA005_40940 [bacterium]|nr:hypothetical protein [bacterium]